MSGAVGGGVGVTSWGWLDDHRIYRVTVEGRSVGFVGVLGDPADEALDALIVATRAFKPDDDAETIGSLRALLVELVGGEDDPCSYDHHGWCQTHYKGGEDFYSCTVARARAVLGYEPIPDRRILRDGYDLDNADDRTRQSFIDRGYTRRADGRWHPTNPADTIPTPG